MAPWVSVILPVFKARDDTFAKLILPIDALKAVDSAKWYWDPSIGDARDVPGGATLLQMANMYNVKPKVDIMSGTWDFCHI